MTQSSVITSDIFYKRLLLFASNCQELIVNLPKNTWNYEYSSQLIRSSASPGANYIEAVEAVSSKDFIHRLKICRKESKESIHWLMLIKHANNKFINIQLKAGKLINEAREFVKIFSSSISTSEKNQQMKKIIK